MAETMQEALERQASDIVQKFLNTFEEKLEKKFDEWFQDWAGKTGLLEEKIIDSVSEEGQTEIKKQEVWEISVFEKGLALEATTEDNNFQNVLEKIQMEKGAEVFLSNLRNDLVWQIGKTYKINFWVFAQNQLLRVTVVYFIIKIRNRILQIGKVGGLFLPEVRRRKEGEIVKKGMG